MHNSLLTLVSLIAAHAVSAGMTGLDREQWTAQALLRLAVTIQRGNGFLAYLHRRNTGCFDASADDVHNGYADGDGQQD